MVSDRHDIAQVPGPQAAVRVREHRATDPRRNGGAGQGRDGAGTQPLVEVGSARGHEDHSPLRLIRAQLATMPVRNRRKNTGDVTQ